MNLVNIENNFANVVKNCSFVFTFVCKIFVMH